MRKLIVFLKYGSKIEINVDSLSDGWAKLKQYKADGMSVMGYEFQSR